MKKAYNIQRSVLAISRIACTRICLKTILRKIAVGDLGISNSLFRFIFDVNMIVVEYFGYKLPHEIVIQILVTTVRDQ